MWKKSKTMLAYAYNRLIVENISDKSIALENKKLYL